jgi:hypothetical protein
MVVKRSLAPISQPRKEGTHDWLAIPAAPLIVHSLSDNFAGAPSRDSIQLGLHAIEKSGPVGRIENQGVPS